MQVVLLCSFVHMKEGVACKNPSQFAINLEEDQNHGLLIGNLQSIWKKIEILLS